MTRPLREALTQALGAMLPTEEQTRLLRAVLYSGEAGLEAWETIRRQPGGMLGLLARDGEAKRLAPLLFVALRRNGANAEPRLLTTLRTAYVREQLRSQELARILGSVLTSLQHAAIEPLLIGGAAVAEAVYDEPGTRHTHALELLLAERDLVPAARVLTPITTPAAARGARASDLLQLVHRSGVPVHLRRGLFQIPAYRLTWEEVWSSSETRTVGGVTVRVPRAAEFLVERCVQAPSAGFDGLLWACDAWFVARRLDDAAWTELLAGTVSRAWTPPLWVTLDYLRGELGAEIPQSALGRLRLASAEVGGERRDAALVWARLGARGYLPLLRRVRGVRARARALGWLIFPSRAHIRQTYGLPQAALPIGGYIRRLWAWGAAHAARPLRQARGSAFCA